MTPTNTDYLKLQLNNIKLKTSQYIRIKCCYKDKEENCTGELDLWFKTERREISNILPLGNFIEDIHDSIINPFLNIQKSSTHWLTISIIHPRSKSKKYMNILNIPLRGVNGYVNNETEAKDNKQYNEIIFQTRYEGSANTSDIILTGIADYYLDPESYKTEECINVIHKCEKIFHEKIKLERSNMALSFVKEKKTRIKNKKNKQNKTYQAKKIYKKPFLVTALPR